MIPNGSKVPSKSSAVGSLRVMRWPSGNRSPGHQDVQCLTWYCLLRAKYQLPWSWLGSQTADKETSGPVRKVHLSRLLYRWPQKQWSQLFLPVCLTVNACNTCCPLPSPYLRKLTLGSMSSYLQSHFVLGQLEIKIFYIRHKRFSSLVK